MDGNLLDKEIVKLNVGGTKFVTTRSTLLSRGENFFSGLLSGKVPSTTFEGYYFIDREGSAFKPILEFLRTGILEIPSHLGELTVLRELQFYGIDISEKSYYLSDVYVREIQFSQIGEISEIKQVVFGDWIDAAKNGQPIRSRIFGYDLETICKLLENEFELSNKNASDYTQRKKQFQELLPEVKEGYNERIRIGELIENTRCVTFLNKDENRAILLDHFRIYHKELSVQISQQRAYRVTYKSYTNMDFNGWQFSNVMNS